MKKSIFTLLIASCIFTTSKAQLNLDSLFYTYILNYDTNGVIYFKQNMINPGESFTLYRELWFDDPNNEMVLKTSWTDSILHMQHYKYQQYFVDIEVEGAEFIEHAKSGKVVYSNGRLVDGISNTLELSMGEEECLGILLDSLSDYEFYWQSDDFEQAIKDELGNEDASYYPQGQLVWALKIPHNLKPITSGDNYVLAWKFEISSILPDEHKIYFVNAINGEIFKSYEMHCTNGPANVFVSGTNNAASNVTIDTRWNGSLSKYILQANDNGRNIHTKYFSNWSWGVTQNITDADDNWGNSEQIGTTTHWMATQAWDYFLSTFGRIGLNGGGKELRVNANWANANARYEHSQNGNDYLTFGSHTAGYLGILDIVGHEYGHGIDHYTAGLIYQGESGALDESFADIYGFLVERFVQPTEWDWLIGEDAITIRDFENPNNENQPDTYRGVNWINPNNLNFDFGGVHFNSGVQNFWFYLLSEGGSGTNDNSDTYTVDAIGIEDAALITYHNHIINMISISNYLMARSFSVASAISLFGNCSFQHREVENAWHAVGVGPRSNCIVANVSKVPSIIDNISIYPNPTNNFLFFNGVKENVYNIEIFNSFGQKVIENQKVSNRFNYMEIDKLNSGIYFVKIKDVNSETVLKFIKK